MEPDNHVSLKVPYQRRLMDGEKGIQGDTSQKTVLKILPDAYFFLPSMEMGPESGGGEDGGGKDKSLWSHRIWEDVRTGWLQPI